MAVKDHRPSKLALAMHEAGHAVVMLARHPRLYFDEVWLDRSADWALGCVVGQPRFKSIFFDVPPPNEAIRALWIEAARLDTVDFLAGPIAELRWRRQGRWGIRFLGPAYRDHCLSIEPDEVEGGHKYGSGGGNPRHGTDLWNVQRLLMWAYPEQPASAFDSAWLEAEEMVGANWAAIQRVGRLLCERERLDVEEVLQAAALD